MTYRDLEFVRVPSILRAKIGRRFIGAAMVLMDSVAQGLAHAARSPWLKSEEGPAFDALRYLGSECSLPRYPGETWPQYKARLERVWEDWPLAGGEPAIVGQFAAAGFPGVQILYFPSEPGPRGEPPPYWSQFSLYFPLGSHPVTGAGEKWGAFNWGSALWGPAGLTAEAAFTMRSIVRKWKPAQWVCRKLIFDLGGPRWGSFAWGDGTVWGGTVSIGA
jgi:hypothetical protein